MGYCEDIHRFLIEWRKGGGGGGNVSSFQYYYHIHVTNCNIKGLQYTDTIIQIQTN